MQYTILNEPMYRLEDKVNYYISKGWKPLGGPTKTSSTMTRDLFMQAMIKNED